MHFSATLGDGDEGHGDDGDGSLYLWNAYYVLSLLKGFANTLYISQKFYEVGGIIST